jgi:hypothetical protein
MYLQSKWRIGLALRGFKRQLVDNSVDAYVLSLETINRLTVNYRIPSFCILLCNAWELLLKARIVDTKNRSAIYHPKKRGEKRTTLSGKKCAEKVFPNDRDPVRKNLEAVIDLRDQSAHLVIANLPSDILELLQSCVLNYHNSLNRWFGISLSDRVPLGMMAFLYELAPLQRDIAVLRKQLGADELKYLAEFQARIGRESKELGYPGEFVARVEHRVVLVNSKGKADFALGKGESEDTLGVVYTAKDPAKTHPLRTMKIVEYINARTNLERDFNTYCFRSVCHEWNVPKHSEWFYRSELDGSSPQYSHALADRIIDKINADPNFVERCRAKFRASQKHKPEGTNTNGHAPQSTTRPEALELLQPAP